MERKEVIISEALLLRFLEGNLSAEEIDRVNRWLDESDENRVIFENISLINYASDVLSNVKNADAQRSLLKVKQKIKRNKYHRFTTWSQRVAAILFIPFFCLSLFFMIDSKEKSDKFSEVQYVEVNSVAGSVTNLVLSDGTKVWLNSNSTIKYPTIFSKKSREVDVRGEVYFSVAKNKEKPFLVNVNNQYKIKVLGTEFNVDAYSANKSVYTTLVKGSIELVSMNNSRKVLSTLVPGEQAIWNSNDKKITCRKVNTMPYTSWKDGKIILQDNSMKEVLRMLEKKYNTSFVLENPQLVNNHFTGTFTNQQLVQILEHFRIASNIQYKIVGRKSKNEDTIDETVVYLR